MTKVDQFESIFRSALHDTYEYALIDIKSVLLVTDLDKKRAKDFLSEVQKFLDILGTSVTWTVLGREDFKTTEEVLDKVSEISPDLICSYRNLFSQDWKYKHSLGSFMDVLVQQTQGPVMVLPHPEAGYKYDHALQDTDRVMALTDHLSGDHNLINYAVRFSPTSGTVYLTHIEDERTFDRYIESISKIPAIETDEAKSLIAEQLLKAPQDYIKSCRVVLEEKNLSIEIESIVEFGQRLRDYKKMIQDHKIDLLIMNSRDEDQLAMHGLVYPLAVELRQIPLLLL